MNQTPLKRWASVQEIAQWAIFLTVENKFATGQSIIVDGGESINSHFVWPGIQNRFYNMDKVTENPFKNRKIDNWPFVSVTALFITSYLVSNIMAVKVV